MVHQGKTLIQKVLTFLLDNNGLDFRDYSENFLDKQIVNWMSANSITTEKEGLVHLRTSEKNVQELVNLLLIGVTRLFRSPAFFLSFRKNIIPTLKTLPTIKIWCAGCSTGEEVYSLAILLKEEGLLDKCQIYCTDINSKSLSTGQTGIYSYETIKAGIPNYVLSGGTSFFSNYYTSQYNSVLLEQELLQKTTWFQHNLVSDQVFKEVDVIICQNVFIYFNTSLQDKVLHLFKQSLLPGGFLCLGEVESIRL
ncbi:MAG: chemotaxis protein methyltransferase CheR, partial [Sphingobacteriales bacterium]